MKIPKVNFENTPFRDAVEALDIMIEKETKGKFAPNFVIQDPHGQLAKREVTIKLGAVPANVVLDYILKMTDAKVRYDQHAIVLMPLGGAPKGKSSKSEEGKGKKSDDPFGS